MDSRLNQDHTRTMRLVPYETHVATSCDASTNANVKGLRWNDEIHVLMGQGRLTSAVLDTSVVPCIPNEQRKATLSLFHCLLNPCLTISNTPYQRAHMWQVKSTITVSCIFIVIDKEISDCTCHIVVPIRMRTQCQCRTHTVGRHGYGQANFTLLTHS